MSSSSSDEIEVIRKRWKKYRKEKIKCSCEGCKIQKRFKKIQREEKESSDYKIYDPFKTPQNLYFSTFEAWDYVHPSAQSTLPIQSCSSQIPQIEEKPIQNTHNSRFQCSICWNNFNDKNILIILDCSLHFYCSVCLESMHQKAESKTIFCPMCRMESTNHFEDLNVLEKKK